MDVRDSPRPVAEAPVAPRAGRDLVKPRINSTVITTASILGALLGRIVAQQLGLHAPFLLGVPLLLAATSVGWSALRPRG